MNSKLVKILVSLSIIISSVSCSKTDVCSTGELELNISKTTLDWLKDEYSSENSLLIFQDISGNEKIFRKDTTYHKEHSWYVKEICEIGDTITVNLKYERIARVFQSDDSIKLSIATNLVPEECQWGGKDNTRMSEAIRISIDNFQDEYVNVSFFNIITNQLNANEITSWCGDDYSIYNSIIIAGENHFNVYGMDSTRTKPGNIFYSKELGLIGFIDKDNSEWKLKQ